MLLDSSNLVSDKLGTVHYKMCVFPDALDQGANLDISYMPGELPWLLADRLEKLGVEVVNKEMSGQCIQDRKLTPVRDK